MVMELLMIAVLVGVVADLALTAVVFVKTCCPTPGERTDKQVEREMAEAVRPDPMDEGFENIMRFAVNGKTGFEPDE